ncbi:MAG: phosphoethanolamine transferase, partial [Muribaculaceae bacterium]|nr:phosphoethanolamine transferase [Muribaculaceae bacterium]
MILRPIHREPLLFLVLILLGSISPIATHLLTEATLKRYIVYSLCINTFEAYLICCLLQYVSNRRVRIVIKTVLYIVYGIFALVKSGCPAILKERFDIDHLLLMLETNSTEATGFFKTYMNFKAVEVWCVILLAIAYIAMMIRHIRKKGGLSPILRTMTAAIVAIMLAGGAVMAYDLSKGLIMSSEEKRISGYDLAKHYYADPLFSSLDLYQDYQFIFQGIGKWEALQQKALIRPLQTDSTRDFHIVVVIGESFIRDHSSLYGYPLPTNPLLQKERDKGNLIVFDDMTSPANLTTSSIRNTLNLNDMSSGEEWSDGIYFPALLKRGGWKVYHYDNQTIDKTKDAGLGRVLFSDFNVAHVLDGRSDRSFPLDMPYVGYTEEKLRRHEEGKSLVIYHLLGQHFPARMYYDGEAVFTPADIKKSGLSAEERQEIADYDNATLYNDRVVARILDSWRGKRAVVFYFSDHGESLPDSGSTKARVSSRATDRNVVRQQFHIPFMVWISDSFKRDYPELGADLERASHRPGTTDRLGWMILGISGIRGEYYHAERDQSSSRYRP